MCGKDLRFGREVPALEVAYPPKYPQLDPVEFTVHCPFLSRQQTEALHTDLLRLATSANGEVVVLQLYQHIVDVLADVRDCHAGTSNEGGSGGLLGSDPERVPARLELGDASLSSSQEEQAPVLGRRAIYFHHVINPNKRRIVKDWASELQLGGFSKIGWPGIVIVEGREADVQDYVRRLQHLRWKQMTVRGEEIEATGVTVDAMRRLPHDFHEFPENGMSALATACRESGVLELFLTAMQIYNRRPEASTSALETQQDGGVKSRRRRRDGNSISISS